MPESAAVVTVDASTKMEVERTRLAYERTLMAWVRTGTSLISFGFTISKFFQEFHKGGQAMPVRTLFGAHEFALIMIRPAWWPYCWEHCSTAVA